MRVITLICIVSLWSCEKKNSVCWNCSFYQSVQGTTEPDRVVCTDGEYPARIQDAAGNDLSYSCVKR